MDTAYNISFQVKVTITEDDDTGYFSATCAQFPEAFAQGKSKDEAVRNLIDLIPFVLKDREETSTAVATISDHAHVYSQSLNVSVFA